MRRFISTIAMTATFLVLVSGLWQDWGFLSTLKRMVMAYLGFFIVGSLMALSVRFVAMFEDNKTPEDRKSSKMDRPEKVEPT